MLLEAQQNTLFVEIDLNIKIDEFEGPIGLLLTLITKNKLDITRISLVKIVDQYIEFSEKHKPDLKTSAEFVRIASILLYLKTVALANTPNSLDEEMEIETTQLLSQLELIKKFRILRDLLKEKRKEKKKMLSKLVKRNMANSKQYSVEDIIRYAVKYFINIQRDKKFSLKRDEVSISEKIEEIKRILQTRHSINFSELAFSQPLTQVIASFMAILETTKAEITSLKQEKNFDDILIIRRNLWSENIAKNIANKEEASVNSYD